MAIKPIDFSRFEPTKRQLMDIVKTAAMEHDLDYILMFALVEQESNWNPWAIRYEPAFYTNHVVPTHHMNLPLTELRADRKSTRLNSSHGYISYAVFCLK